MHKRTIRLVISAIMLALFVSVPVDAAGQERGPRERAGLRQQERDRSPRARSDQRRAVPRTSAPRDSDRRDNARMTPRGYERPRDYERRGSYRRGFGQRGFSQFSFGRRGGFRSRFNFNFQLGRPQYYMGPQYYPPYYGGCGYWDEPDYTVVYRGGRWVREYFCVNMAR